MSEMLPVDRMHMRHEAAEDEATDGDRPLPAWTIHAAAIGIGLVLGAALYGWGRYSGVISMDWVGLLCG
ncbi:hypothetical protein [Tistrella mobilis]|nr:hypothetical protein [Tistrella mobilis]MAM73550.1 hypothetical protein [Tistrella sp.]